jgi:hypothetical protein
LKRRSAASISCSRVCSRRSSRVRRTGDMS